MMVNHGAKVYSHTNTINTVNTDAETHTICQLLIMAGQYFAKVCMFKVSRMKSL